MVAVRIDPETGDRAGSGDKGAIFEIFRADHVPKQRTVDRRSLDRPYAGGGNSSDELF
jgi:hypothetical protein